MSPAEPAAASGQSATGLDTAQSGDFRTFLDDHWAEVSETGSPTIS